eukprot:488819-Hanusia_phi.AAC.2
MTTGKVCRPHVCIARHTSQEEVGKENCSLLWDHLRCPWFEGFHGAERLPCCPAINDLELDP